MTARSARALRALGVLLLALGALGPALAGGAGAPHAPGAAVPGPDARALATAGVSGAASFSVTGVLTDPNGTPIAGASISVNPGPTLTTAADGTFSVRLANATYAVTASASYFLPATFSLTVSGEAVSVHWTLARAPLYEVSGTVVDAASFRPVPNASVVIYGSYGVYVQQITGGNGSFSFRLPAGFAYLTVAAPEGYGGVQESLQFPAGATTGLDLELVPAAETNPSPGGLGATASLGLPLVALTLGALTLGFWGVSYARRREGLPPAVLSPFGRWVAMRLLLMPVQVLILVAILFLFGSFLPSLSGSVPACVGAVDCARKFFPDYLTFTYNLVSGNWGSASFGRFTAPVTDYFAWWLPNSLELGLVSFGLSALIAFPLGLRSGWIPDGPLDTGTRAGTLAGLLLPSFLVILLLLLALYDPFSWAVGDQPYGLLPSLGWYPAGLGPSWAMGPAGNTLPTGFPLVDGALHGAWAFEFVVLMKTLLQAFIIALVYVAIFLRYGRHAVVERARSLPIVAARARGVPESTLLWRHTAREVLPVYLLIFGITLPMFIGTQALTEALFNDNGIGRVLLVEMTSVVQTGFGVHSATVFAAGGNLYQVTIFLLLLVILVSSLLSDILAHYLDPRLAQSPRGR